MVVTLIWRSAAGERVWDRKLGTAAYDIAPDDPASSDAFYAALRAAEALLAQRGR